MGDAVGGGVMAAPVTYAIDGRQYVSVLAGWGGAYGVLGKSSRQPFPGRVLTFALGGGGTLPGAAPAAPRQRPEPIPFTADAAQVAEGAATYARYCSVCHGPQAVSGGVLPDLRLAAPETFAEIEAILLTGTRASKGMPSFADVLTAADAARLRQYLLQRRSDVQ